MKKTPTCKGCKGTGTVCIDGEGVSRPIDMTCWVCGGSAFKGMDKAQIVWYLDQYKVFTSLKEKSLRAGKPFDPAAYATVKEHVDIACKKLGIAQQPVPRVRSTFNGQSDDQLFLRAELNEYERRLTAVPVAMAQKVAAA
jgi:hypothetical protein